MRKSLIFLYHSGCSLISRRRKYNKCNYLLFSWIKIKRNKLYLPYWKKPIWHFFLHTYIYHVLTQASIGLHPSCGFTFSTCLRTGRGADATPRSNFQIVAALDYVRDVPLRIHLQNKAEKMTYITMLGQQQTADA